MHGVTYDGEHVWFATGDTLHAFDPKSGQTLRSIDVAAHAGTAFDGRHLFQLAEDRILKIDPETGRVLASIAGEFARNGVSIAAVRQTGGVSGGAANTLEAGTMAHSA